MHTRTLFAVFALAAVPLCAQSDRSPWSKVPTRSYIDEWCQKNQSTDYCRAYFRGDKEGMAKAMTAAIHGPAVQWKGNAPAARAASGTRAAAAPIPPASAEVLPDGTPLWRFAHPNAGMVFSVNLKALLQSPVVESLWKLFGAMIPGNGALDAARRELAGIELMMFSMRTKPDGSPDVMMLIRGDNLQPLTRGKPSVRYLDPKTALLGEWNTIHYAIQRVITPGQIAAKEERVREFSKWGDLWMVIDLATLKAMAASAGKVTPALPGFHRMSLAMTLGEEMTMEAWADTASAAAANKLFAEMETNMGGVPGLGDLTAGFVSDLKKEVRGNSVRLYAKTDARALAELMKQKAPAAAAAEPPKRKTVIIQGMEGGPKEIPVTRQ